MKAIDVDKLLEDLNSLKGMFVAAGDPVLVAIMNRVIDIVERQPKTEV